MCLHKFIHILLLKSDAQLKQKKSDKKSNHPNLLGKKNHVKRKNKNKKIKKERKREKKKKSNEACLKKKKKKEQRNGQAHVQVHMSIFVIYLSNSSHSIFSPFWRENILVGSERKHLSPTNFFSLPSLQPNIHQKSFYSYFLFKIFHPPYFTSKQIHPKSSKKKKRNSINVM